LCTKLFRRLIPIYTENNYRLCENHIYKYVKITTNDGTIHRGYVVKVDQQNVTMAIENEPASSGEDRWSPFLFWTIPLLAITAIAARRRRYPYPSYYPYAPYPVPYSYPAYYPPLGY